MGDNLDEMDQLIFKQYMEEMDAEEAQALANGNGGGANMGGFNDQMPPELGVRKADSHKYGQLIGGDDEEFEDHSDPHQQQNFDMIGGQGHGQHNYGMPPPMGLGPQVEEQMNFGAQPNSEDDLAKAIAASMEENYNAPVDSEMDSELAQALEMSKNLK